MIKLLARAEEGVSFPKMVGQSTRFFQADGAVALLYAPRWCKLCLLSLDGRLESDGRSLTEDEMGDVFEARLFSSKGEVRWLARERGKGKAVFLSEEDLDGFKGTDLAAVEAVAKLENSYVLWGTAVGETADGNWSRLEEYRMGSLAVPLSGLAPRERVAIRSREYVACDDDGNAYVAEELLVRLEVIPGGQEKA